MEKRIVRCGVQELAISGESEQIDTELIVTMETEDKESIQLRFSNEAAQQLRNGINVTLNKK